MLARTNRSFAAFALAAVVAFTVSAHANARGQVIVPTATVAFQGMRGHTGTALEEIESFRIPERLVAESFHRLAVRYHSQIDRWTDAAILHLVAAELRGFQGEASLEDLRLAASLFNYVGETGRACAAMERAAQVALAAGLFIEADQCFGIVPRVGDRGCSESWEELFDALVVPAPGPIEVGPPTLQAVDLREGFSVPRIRTRVLAVPPVWRESVILPPPPVPIEVEEPLLQPVVIREPRWHRPIPPRTGG